MIKLNEVRKLESFSDEYKWNPKTNTLFRGYRVVEPDWDNWYHIYLKHGLTQPYNHDWIAEQVEIHHNSIKEESK